MFCWAKWFFRSLESREFLLSPILQRSIQCIHPVEDVFQSSISRPPYGQMGKARWSFMLEPVRYCFRDEAKEVRPDARPQAWKNRIRIRWNTLRIFSGRTRRSWPQIVRRSRTVNVGQAPRTSQRGIDWNLQ